MLKWMLPGALMVLLSSGCGGNATSESPNDTETADASTTTGEDAGDDGEDIVETEPALCVGLTVDEGGTCVPMPTGPNACTTANCPSFAVQLACMDKDNSGYHDDADESAILVDANWALFPEGDGTEETPYGSIQEALEVAQDGDTIAIAGNEASYRESITLANLANITLLGPGVCDGKNGVTLHGEAADATVHLLDMPGARVEGFEIRGNGIAVHLEGNAENTRIQGNKLTQMGSDGVRLTNVQATGCEIAGNLIRNSLGSACGVRFLGGAGGTLSGNEIRSIIGAGVCATDSVDFVLTKNTIHSNQSVGIALSGAAGAIHDNTLRENTQGGVVVHGAGAGTTTLVGNRIQDNGDFGVLYAPGDEPAGGNGVEVRHNLISSEPDAPQSIGVMFPDETPEFTVSNCEITGMAGPGILTRGDHVGVPSSVVPSGDTPSQIARNVIEGTQVAGIHISGVLGMVLSDNRIVGVTGLEGSPPSAGVIGIQSSLLVQGGALLDCDRFGAVFEKSKAALNAVEFSGNIDDVGCTDPACTTIQHTSGSPVTDVDLLPNDFEVLPGDDFIPTP